MSATPPATSAPEPARPASGGLLVVGTIAAIALALGIYAAFFRQPPVAATNSSHVPVASSDTESRITALETRLTAVERDRAPSVSDAATDASPAPARSQSSPAGNAHDTGPGHYDVVPNTDLKGRLGRLVVEFPQGDDIKARIEAFQAGDNKSLRTEYGNIAAEMTAGSYDLNIGGAMVTNVPIKSGHDTRVHVGLLRLNATGNTRFEIFVPGADKSIGTHYGQTDVGLPVATFEVAVNGLREPVRIESGKVAEF
jgi:hypothetical protein